MAIRFTNTLLAAGVLTASAGLSLGLSHAVASAPQAQAQATAVLDEQVDQILAKSVEAMGGKDAISKINTVHTVMEMNAPGPQGEMKVELETMWSRNGGRIFRTKMPQGEVEMGTDGKAAWRRGMMGSGTLTKDETENLNDQCSMVMHLLEPQDAIKREMTKVEDAGTATFEGKECHKLHFVSAEGEEGDLYYDAATHLPVGMESISKQRGMEVRQKVILSEWQDVPGSGVKVYRTMSGESSAQPGMKMAMKMTKVEFNTLSDATFAPPAGTGKPAEAPGAGVGAGGGAGAGTGGAAAGGDEIKLEDMTPEQQTQAKAMVDRLKSGGDVEKMKQAVSQIEPTLSMIPDEAKRKPIAYALQEIKKEIAKAGG